ncbi:short-chain dehydrogenase [Ilyonectria robusta]|uniref:short-chain dehydrogenase n=1 Tax=Ilyonectria robusta TaxID=1079257 RepID=UPI001E8DB4B1|nr:short-chain dehydrogenase [Ilyonectria robusta]KAH8675043.1 short-chain dehydrogenase [Ilyonectria robusta]
MDSSALFRVDGIVAVISGGGTGLGLMMTRALAGAGAKRVYILGRRQATLEAAATAHPSICPLVCDVTSKNSLQAAVDTISNDFGYINLIIANSGVLGPLRSFDPEMTIQELRRNLFGEVTIESFTDVLHVNVTGAYFTILAFLELLDAGNKNAVKGGYGAPLNSGSKVPSIQSQVIITGSVGSFSRERASPPAYVASKSAIAQLASHASTNLAPYQIRVNTLAPGFFPSEMADFIISSRDPETETLDHQDFMPARRFGTEEEMGGSILYLASRAGAYCNGLVLANDGGRLSVIPSTY